jgi:hypothetical protein
MADTWDDLIDEWNQKEFFDWIEEQFDWIEEQVVPLNETGMT